MSWLRFSFSKSGKRSAFSFEVALHLVEAWIYFWTFFGAGSRLEYSVRIKRFFWLAWLLGLLQNFENSSWRPIPPNLPLRISCIIFRNLETYWYGRVRWMPFTPNTSKPCQTTRLLVAAPAFNFRLAFFGKNGKTDSGQIGHIPEMYIWYKPRAQTTCKTRPFSNQNKGHLSSRYIIYIYICSLYI